MKIAVKNLESKVAGKRIVMTGVIIVIVLYINNLTVNGSVKHVKLNKPNKGFQTLDPKKLSKILSKQEKLTIQPYRRFSKLFVHLMIWVAKTDKPYYKAQRSHLKV